MKIIVDNPEEHQLIENLCDIALRAAGMRNLQVVEKILNAIEPVENHQEKEDE